MGGMPNPRNTAIQAVVDAWTIPGIDPQEHADWQARLQLPSPDGWPMLAAAVQQLVAVEQERARGRSAR